MFLVVAMKLRPFFSFPCSANEQVCRSWEEAQPGRQLSWSMEIFHTIDMHSLWIGVGWGGRNLLLFFHEFNIFWEFCKIREIYEFCDHCSGPGWELIIRRWERILLYIASFAYSVVIIIIIIIIINFVVLLKCLYLSAGFYSPLHPTEGGEEQVSGCVVLVTSCWVKPRHVWCC